MSHETVMLEIPNVFEDGEEASIAVLSRKFNIAAERFNQYSPVPLYRTAMKNKTPITRDTKPDSYILVVDVPTAEEIERQLKDVQRWEDPRIGPAPN